MKELHLKQIDGTVKMIPANNLDTISDQYFKEEYADFMIKEHNANGVHVAMEKREFKTVGGLPRKVSTSMVQKFTKEVFAQMTAKGSKAFQGYVTHILHLPTDVKIISTAPADDDKDGKEGDAEITLENINAMTSAKEAKELYLHVTGTEAVKNWTLDKVKEEIIAFLGLGSTTE